MQSTEVNLFLFQGKNPGVVYQSSILFLECERIFVEIEFGLCKQQWEREKETVTNDLLRLLFFATTQPLGSVD